jgi:hypothetical protein
MDRRQRKREQKKKKRDLAKKKARAALERRPDPEERLLRAAARSPFGPCYINTGWQLEEELPGLVSVVVTRRLPDGDLVPGVALVDRTCLGIKSAHARDKVTDDEFQDLIADMDAAQGGMEPCEPLVAQSVVYHAADYARRLGFTPDPDFPELLFGPRPAELVDTPLRDAARPIYVRGPRDDVQGIVSQLVTAVGADGFTYVDDIGLGNPEDMGLDATTLEALAALQDEDDDDDDEPEPDDATA